MPTRRPTHQTARAGEYYVAAELNRRGFDAVTFTGNMPGIDVIAVAADKRTFYIQVKAQTGHGWSVNIDERLRPATPGMFWVLVLLPNTGEAPRYWVIPDDEMRGIIQGQYDDRPHQFAGKIKLCRLKMEAVEDREGGWCNLG